MDSTSARVDPKEVFVTELIANCAIKDLYGGGDKKPASRTYVGLRAATADGIVICHIDIENELALEWFEGGWPHRFLVSRLHATGDLLSGTRRVEVGLQLTLALYTGPISNLVGLRVHTCFFSSSAFAKEL